MLYGPLLILLVIGVSGFIAYIGDQIGMKVGKKRISIFGLRPKYTSILVTIITGVLIASLAITVILVTNNVVRQAIFNIQEVVTKLNTTRDDLEKKNNLLTEKDKELEIKNQKIADKEQEIEKRTEELSDLQRQKEQLAEEKEQLLKEKEQLTQEYTALKRQKEEVQEQKDKLQVKLEDTQQEYKIAQQNIEKLKKEQQELENQIASLNQEKNKLKMEWYNVADRLYMKDLIYQKGDIIYLDVLEKGDTEKETNDNISEFLKKANEEVKKKPVKVENDSGMKIKTGEILRFFMTVQQSDVDRFVAKAVADTNITNDMMAHVTLQLSPDFIVYSEGEQIIERTLQVDKSLSVLQSDLKGVFNAIIINSVRKGIIGADQSTIGDINFINFYEVFNKLQTFKGKVKIKAFASDKIWVEDGWNGKFFEKIRFDIEAADGN